MTNTIKCPHCGKEVEVTEALKHQIEEQVLTSVSLKHKQDIELVRKQTQQDADEKAKKDFEMTIRKLEDESKDERIRAKNLQDQVLELTKEIRKARQEKEDARLEMEKKLAKEEEEIKIKTRKQVEEEHRLNDLEKEKKLQDALKMNDELKRKLEQGSQQTQGEVLELDLENLLRHTFLTDVIEAVGKGVRGADLRQMVKTARGNFCGVILWESKRTKSWSDEWISKLKDDLRAEKAHVAVLITNILPKEAESGFGFKSGIWVCNYQLIIPLAQLLRQKLTEIAWEKFVNQNKETKNEMIYEYVTGHEFRQSIEALVEIYQDMHKQILRERSAFEAIWKKREAQIQKFMVNISGIYGKMRGLIGSTLPSIKGIELLELGDGDDSTNT